MSATPNALRIEMDYEGVIVEFAADPQQSELYGLVDHANPEERWLDITVRCSGARIVSSREPIEDLKGEEEHYTYQGCRLTLHGLPFPSGGWKALTGEEWEVAYQPEEVHPILPGGPGNLYFGGQHHVPNNNRIRVTEREGSLFRLSWECDAEGYAGERGTRVRLDAAIPFRRVRVYFRDPQSVDLDSARALAHRFADPGEVGEATRESDGWVSLYWNDQKPV